MQLALFSWRIPSVMWDHVLAHILSHPLLKSTGCSLACYVQGPRLVAAAKRAALSAEAASLRKQQALSKKKQSDNNYMKKLDYALIKGNGNSKGRS